GAAGAHPGHEMGDTALGLRPDLRTGRLVVRAGVVRVRVLVGLPGAGDLLHQAVGDGVVRARVFRRHRRRTADDLRAVGPEHVLLVLADLVRADEHAAVATGLRHQGQPDTRVATGRLDDRPARREQAVALGGLDHPGGDAVLH